jgi:hypothetical protein
MAGHVDLLGILYAIWGALSVLLGLALISLGLGAVAIFTAGGLDPQSEVTAGITAVIFCLAGVVALVWGVLHVWDGLSLRQHRPWARLLGLLLAVFNLFSFPFGTALGMYALWVMVNDHTRVLFGRAPRHPATA